jgi:hypothetical protein
MIDPDFGELYLATFQEAIVKLLQSPGLFRPRGNRDSTVKALRHAIDLSLPPPHRPGHSACQSA